MCDSSFNSVTLDFLRFVISRTKSFAYEKTTCALSFVWKWTFSNDIHVTKVFAALIVGFVLACFFAVFSATTYLDESKSIARFAKDYYGVIATTVCLLLLLSFNELFHILITSGFAGFLIAHGIITSYQFYKLEK